MARRTAVPKTAQYSLRQVSSSPALKVRAPFRNARYKEGLGPRLCRRGHLLQRRRSRRVGLRGRQTTGHAVRRRAKCYFAPLRQRERLWPLLLAAFSCVRGVRQHMEPTSRIATCLLGQCPTAPLCRRSTQRRARAPGAVGADTGPIGLKTVFSFRVVLRSGAGNHDVGYPCAVQRADGQMVAATYFNDDPDGERYIGATIRCL